MAKVMISLPDELLERVDAEAARRRTSRSGVLRDFTCDALDRRAQRLARRMGELEGEASDRGGDVVAQLRESRPR